MITWITNNKNLQYASSFGYNNGSNSGKDIDLSNNITLPHFKFIL